MFTAMILDSLDGMHARRTKQTSKRGEFLDHWLDAIHIPLVSGTVALMLDVNPLILGLTMVLGSSIYNAQLCLYYRTGKFVSPPTSGMEAQVIGTGVLTLTGQMFYFSNRYTPAVAWTIWAICVAAVWAQGCQWWFFFDRLGRRPGGIFTFTLQVAALFGLYYWNGLGRLTFIVAVVFLSFRSSGTYVLRTLAKKPYDGHDIVSWAFIALAWAGFVWAPDVSLLGQSLTVLAVAAGAAVQIARNVVEVVRDRAALTPPARAGA
jgi:phosphatidylglycerophosphate synthase